MSPSRAAPAILAATLAVAVAVPVAGARTFMYASKAAVAPPPGSQPAAPAAPQAQATTGADAAHCSQDAGTYGYVGRGATETGVQRQGCTAPPMVVTNYFPPDIVQGRYLRWSPSVSGGVPPYAVSLDAATTDELGIFGLAFDQRYGVFGVPRYTQFLSFGADVTDSVGQRMRLSAFFQAGS